jgi:hypothetical protein
VISTGRSPEAALRALSCVFLDPATWPEVSRLSPQDFPDENTRTIFGALKKLSSHGDELSLANVAELDREAYLAFDAREKDLHPRAKIGEVTRYVERMRADTVTRQGIDEILRLADRIEKNGAKVAPEDFLRVGAFGAQLECTRNGANGRPLGSLSTAELFRAQATAEDWLARPILAPGLSTIVDALPKVGKTVLILEGIHASFRAKPFLGWPTKPIRAVYVSEQSSASLAVQVREVGFTGQEPAEELRWITREEWSRYVYSDFLRQLENTCLAPGNYNALVFDTWHSIARLEDENDASEVNRLGNLTIDLATRRGTALCLGRHDRKSGGEVGLSGRSSIQLSGLMDVIVHLTRGNAPSQRKLELVGRVPGLPYAQIIELQNGEYVNWGEPGDRDAADEIAALDKLLAAEPTIGYRSIAVRTGIGKNRIRKIAESAGWTRDDSGQWSK